MAPRSRVTSLMHGSTALSLSELAARKETFYMLQTSERGIFCRRPNLNQQRGDVGTKGGSCAPVHATNIHSGHHPPNNTIDATYYLGHPAKQSRGRFESCRHGWNPAVGGTSGAFPFVPQLHLCSACRGRGLGVGLFTRKTPGTSPQRRSLAGEARKCRSHSASVEPTLTGFSYMCVYL